MRQKVSQRGKELHSKFRGMRTAWRALWVQYGRYAVEFDDEALYREFGFGSFKAYWKSLPKALPYSTVAEAMNVLRAFPKMKDTELTEFPKENLKLLAKLPRRRQLVYMRVAKDMESNELRNMINAKDNQHLEGKVKHTYLIEKSVSPLVDAAIEKMIDDADDEIDKNVAFGLIMARFVVGDSVAIIKKVNTPATKTRGLNLE